MVALAAAAAPPSSLSPELDRGIAPEPRFAAQHLALAIMTAVTNPVRSVGFVKCSVLHRLFREPRGACALRQTLDSSAFSHIRSAGLFSRFSRVSSPLGVPGQPRRFCGLVPPKFLSFFKIPKRPSRPQKPQASQHPHVRDFLVPKPRFAICLLPLRGSYRGTATNQQLSFLS